MRKSKRQRQQVSFLLKNPHSLLKNPHFLSRNLHFLLKNGLISV